MPLRLHDAFTGKLQTFEPAQPPLVDFRWDPAGDGAERRRQEAVVGALLDALVFFGYSVNQNVTGEERADLCAASAKPERAALWLRLGPVQGDGAPGGAAWRLFCLRTPYRKPLVLSPDRLREAEAELGRWRAAVASLPKGEPNPKGLAVYRQRFRDALAADFDTAGALDVVRDALRPGALSPASLLAFFKEADEALGLGLSGS